MKYQELFSLKNKIFQSDVCCSCDWYLKGYNHCEKKKLKTNGMIFFFFFSLFLQNKLKLQAEHGTEYL